MNYFTWLNLWNRNMWDLGKKRNWKRIEGLCDNEIQWTWVWIVDFKFTDLIHWDTRPQISETVLECVSSDCHPSSRATLWCVRWVVGIKAIYFKQCYVGRNWSNSLSLKLVASFGLSPNCNLITILKERGNDIFGVTIYDICFLLVLWSWKS